MGMRLERAGMPTPSSGSLSVSTWGLWYLRYPWVVRDCGGDWGDVRALEELRRLKGTSSCGKGAGGLDSRGVRSAYDSSFASRAKLSIGPSDLRSGEGISDALGEERVQLSGDMDRGGRSGWIVGLGGEPIMGVEMEEPG